MMLLLKVGSAGLLSLDTWPLNEAMPRCDAGSIDQTVMESSTSAIMWNLSPATAHFRALASEV